ncbi:MAG TPA: hypothetical protein VK116_02250, partial [Planctomycetota bacterium]|nr:hypothetical protein [Planctomycetota bacterium]
RHAAQALAMIGIDLSRHRSCGLDPETLARADTVLVMAEEHARAVVEVAPDASPRIARLWRYADAPSASGEIADPVGRTIYDFLACRDVLIECLRSWVLERFGKTGGPSRG